MSSSRSKGGAGISLQAAFAILGGHTAGSLDAATAAVVAALEALARRHADRPELAESRDDFVQVAAMNIIRAGRAGTLPPLGTDEEVRSYLATALSRRAWRRAKKIDKATSPALVHRDRDGGELAIIDVPDESDGSTPRERDLRPMAIDYFSQVLLPAVGGGRSSRRALSCTATVELTAGLKTGALTMERATMEEASAAGDTSPVGLRRARDRIYQNSRRCAHDLKAEIDRARAAREIGEELAAVLRVLTDELARLRGPRKGAL
jgi:hypothetical protein